MSGEPTFTFPPPIVDMLAQGLRSLYGPEDSIWVITHGERGVEKVWMMTDSGPITILRGPDMERT